MKICIAQTRSIAGNVLSNIEKHKIFVNLAIAQKADTIFFPELSITGYEPQLAKDLTTNQDDKLFDDFQELSNINSIVIGLGTPTKINSGILISMIIFQPHIPRQTYSKQQLHPDEFPYFINGEKQLIVSIDNIKIAPAICYESLQTDHSDNAFKLGADIYVASVAKSQSGIEKAMNHFPTIAKKNAIPVLMSNCVGYCDNFLSVGKSAVWNKNGELVGQLDDNNEGVLIFDTKTEKVIKRTI